jgi:hypothetical protein
MSIGHASPVILAWTVAAAWLGAVALAIADRLALRRLPESAVVTDSPGVTLIVPARNEERTIGAWLGCARQQNLAGLRIIVADDASQDETVAAALRAAACDPRVRVVRCAPPPAGWVGKTWAAHSAALLARTEWLAFSDADMRMEPGLLSGALHVAQAWDADALSATCRLECRTLAERWVMPVIGLLIFTGFPICVTNSDRWTRGILAGGFLLVRRPAYELVGGHAAVRGSIAEDRDLAERLKAFGFRIRIVDGTRFLRVRMYEGWADMWAGWTKNFYEGVYRNPAAAILATAGIVAMFVLPAPVLVWSLLSTTSKGRTAEGRRDNRRRGLAWAAAISMGAGIVCRLLRDPTFGIRSTADSLLAMPVAGLFAASVMVASAWNVISGRGQRWKGRVIPPRAGPVVARASPAVPTTEARPDPPPGQPKN